MKQLFGHVISAYFCDWKLVSDDISKTDNGATHELPF